MLAIMQSFYEIASTIFTKNYKNFGLTFIKDDDFLTFIASIDGVLNIIFKFLSGYLVDKMSLKVLHNYISYNFEIVRL